MKECTRHRDAVVRFGAYYDRCPLCAVIERTQEALDQVGAHTPRDATDLCVDVRHVERIIALVET